MGSLVAEIEDRLALLSDPNTVWVQKCPDPGTSCLVLDVIGPHDEHNISFGLSLFLGELVTEYARVADGAPSEWFRSGYEVYDPETGQDLAPLDAVEFNDFSAKSRQDVIDFLNVALDIAEDEQL